jgi:hypothetical protein
MEQRQDGQTVRVAGLVVMRQCLPTAKGHVFITLEDEEGRVKTSRSAWFPCEVSERIERHTPYA